MNFLLTSCKVSIFIYSFIHLFHKENSVISADTGNFQPSSKNFRLVTNSSSLVIVMEYVALSDGCFSSISDFNWSNRKLCERYQKITWNKVISIFFKDIQSEFFVFIFTKIERNFGHRVFKILSMLIHIHVNQWKFMVIHQCFISSFFLSQYLCISIYFSEYGHIYAYFRRYLEIVMKIFIKLVTDLKSADQCWSWTQSVHDAVHRRNHKLLQVCFIMSVMKRKHEINFCFKLLNNGTETLHKLWLDFEDLVISRTLVYCPLPKHRKMQQQWVFIQNNILQQFSSWSEFSY